MKADGRRKGGEKGRDRFVYIRLKTVCAVAIRETVSIEKDGRLDGRAIERTAKGGHVFAN